MLNLSHMPSHIALEINARYLAVIKNMNIFMKSDFPVETNWTLSLLHCNLGLISIMLHELRKNGSWQKEYKTNILDTYGMEKESSL